MQAVADPRLRLRAAVDRSHRTVVPFSRGFFVRPEKDAPLPALARLLRGGRAGDARLKLYLTICLLGVRSPHSVVIVPHQWAEMLELSENEANGVRRIRSALAWLESNKLVQIERESGKNPRVFLLDQSGYGDPYRRPKASGELYANIPAGFWRNGWILRTSPPAIAILIVLLQLQHGIEPPDRAWVRSPWAYGFSADTWTKGVRQLTELGILSVERSVRGDELEQRRRRNLYWIDVARFEVEPPAHSLPPSLAL